MLTFLLILNFEFARLLASQANCRVDQYKSILMNIFILILFLFFIFSCMFSPSPTPYPHSQNLSEFNIKCEKIGLNWIYLPQIILFGSGLVFLFWFILLHLCNHVNFVTFNTNLSVFRKKDPTLNPIPILWLVLVIVLGLFLSEYPDFFSTQFLLNFHPIFPFLTNVHPNVSKSLARGCFHISCMLIFTFSISPATLILSVFVFQMWCHAPTHLTGKRF